MSLLMCIDCDGKVSSRISACPHCGCPVDETFPLYESEISVFVQDDDSPSEPVGLELICCEKARLVRILDPFR